MALAGVLLVLIAEQINGNVSMAVTSAAILIASFTIAGWVVGSLGAKWNANRTSGAPPGRGGEPHRSELIRKSLVYGTCAILAALLLRLAGGVSTEGGWAYTFAIAAGAAFGPCLEALARRRGWRNRTLSLMFGGVFAASTRAVQHSMMGVASTIPPSVTSVGAGTIGVILASVAIQGAAYADRNQFDLTGQWRLSVEEVAVSRGFADSADPFWDKRYITLEATGKCRPRCSYQVRSRDIYALGYRWVLKPVGTSSWSGRVRVMTSCEGQPRTRRDLWVTQRVRLTFPSRGRRAINEGTFVVVAHGERTRTGLRDGCVATETQVMRGVAIRVARSD